MIMSFIISSVVHTHLSVGMFMFAHAQRDILKCFIIMADIWDHELGNPDAIGKPWFDRERYMVSEVGS